MDKKLVIHFHTAAQMEKKVKHEMNIVKLQSPNHSCFTISTITLFTGLASITQFGGKSSLARGIQNRNDQTATKHVASNSHVLSTCWTTLQ